MPGVKVALVQSNPAVQWAADAGRAGFDLHRFVDPAALLRANGEVPPAVVVLSDFAGGTWAAIESARKVKRMFPAAPIVLVATESSEAIAIAAIKVGVADYLKCPVTSVQVLDAIVRCMPRAPEAMRRASGVHRFIGESPQIRSVFSYASKVALTNSNVLLTGETGTGKDFTAEFIHAVSVRNGKPFVALNCAAIPDSLLESELFGRERGAYTGADHAYQGRLQQADGGTVLLDEISELTPIGQAKLLRVLESRRIQRLGSAADVPVNIRILAATNQDLAAMVERGQFRRDLYFRLRVTRMELPTLRSRREDIPALLTHFARHFAADAGRQFPGFSPRAVRALTGYDWPGNVRELRNTVEELFVDLGDEPVDVDDLPVEVTGRGPRVQLEDPSEGTDEKTRIVSALTSTRWNKKRAAERLHWSRMTLYRKMAFYRIVADEAAAIAPESTGAGPDSRRCLK
jgi:DNA-binding NtrC family response regulator